MFAHCYRLLPWLLLIASASLPAAAQEQEPARAYPSAELLEFLADFGNVDEDTYDLIEFHAIRDMETPDREPSQDD